MSAVTLVFYTNIALMFCAAAELSLIALTRKTAYARAARAVAVSVTCAGLIAFVVQLAAYSLSLDHADIAVYAALAVTACGFIATAAYCAALSIRSNRGLAVAAAIACSIPPLGVIMTAALMSRLRKDTCAESLVYRGRGYTYAALTAAYRGENVDFVDAAETEQFDDLNKKDAAKLLKQLKKDRKTPEGQFRYAEALLRYSPSDRAYAIKLTEKAAKRGNAEAAFNLGYFHELGLYGVKRDGKLARRLYSFAADCGDADAKLRLGILDAKSGRADGADVFKDGAATDDAARFDLALCYERGIGVAADIVKASGLYAACAENGMTAARRRLFAMAAEAAVTGKPDHNGVDGSEFGDGFGDVLCGVDEIRARRAPEAAERFLAAVKRRDAWEGIARLFVGTLYLDCGALERDRRNGAAYVKSAVGMTELADDVFHAVPKRLVEASTSARDGEYQKKHERDAKRKPQAQSGDDVVTRDSIEHTEFDENF